MGIQSLQVIEADGGRMVHSVSYAAPNSVFVGLAYSPDGTKAYASGGGFDVVHTYGVGTDGSLTEAGDITIGTRNDNPFPTGLSLSPDGTRLYVANDLANNVAIVDTASESVTATVGVGAFPYTTLASRDGSRVYVSNWGDARVSVIDVASGAMVSTIAVGEHPSAMVLGRGNLLYVADANSDAVSVVDTEAGREIRRLSVAAYPGAALGTSPQGLALSPDGQSLYVADAGHNDVAVFHLEAGGERLVGRVPTAWYPTAVVAGADGRTLYVTNAKGVGAGRNNVGMYPNPARPSVPFQDAITGYADGYCQCTFNNYTGSMMLGTLSSIEIPQAGRLAVYTDRVARSNRDRAADSSERSAGNPIPVPGGTSPIKHVIYVIKENRTFDQVFGDEAMGDTDPRLTLFGRDITPNMHALAERFGLLDNFYADAEVSADGHNWATSANASDYNEKMWPQNYSPGDGRNRPYDFEGASRINLSPGGYVWDAAAEAGISFRDYGEFVQFDGNYPASKAKLIAESDASGCAGPIARSYTNMEIPAGQVLCFLPMQINPQTTPALVNHVDERFRTYDLRYREIERVAEWQREFGQFVANGNLPALEILRLPNDHTSGTRPGSPTPQAMVAENDFALGKLVEIVSTSPLLGQHGDLRDGRRRAERARPHRRASHHVVRDQPVHVAAGAARRAWLIRHGGDAANNGADPGPAATEPVRCGRDADVADVPGQA